jgi:hypothetical protein
MVTWSVVGWPDSGALHGLEHAQLTHPAAQCDPLGLGCVRGQPVLVVERIRGPIVASLVIEQGQIAVDDDVLEPFDLGVGGRIPDVTGSGALCVMQRC